MVKSFINIVAWLLLAGSIFAQTENEIERQNQELEKIRRDLKALEEKLETRSEEESSTLETLNDIKNKEFLLNRVLKKIHAEEKKLNSSISDLSNTIEELEEDIDTLKKEYASYVRWMYKNDTGAKLSMLLSAESVNQAFLRYKYFNYVTEKYGEVSAELENKINRLKSSRKKLAGSLEQKKEVAREKEAEEDKLLAGKTEQEKLIAGLRKDKELIEKEIEEKRKAQFRIRDLITRLIEESRKEEEKLRGETRKVEVKTEIDYTGFEDFGTLKGKLIWPAVKGRIVRNFGEVRNAKLKTVTLNYGIDISSGKDSDVKAVAGGIVSVIDFIPGYGSIVILTHKNGYRTVYGHIRDISVAEGDQVEAGTPIGKVNSSLEGHVLHFEIWKDRENQNPVEWLARN